MTARINLVLDVACFRQERYSCTALERAMQNERAVAFDEALLPNVRPGALRSKAWLDAEEQYARCTRHLAIPLTCPTVCGVLCNSACFP
jgi:hypothetical protein